MEKTPELDLFHALSFYSLAHPDQPYFIHQHVVDAYAVQHLTSHTKMIKATYGLLGLCLYLEYGFSGKEVQNVHVQLSNDKTNWPDIRYPLEPINFSIRDILNASEGNERDAKIREWCEVVWEAHQVNQQAMRDWLKMRDIIS